ALAYDIVWLTSSDPEEHEATASALDLKDAPSDGGRSGGQPGSNSSGVSVAADGNIAAPGAPAPSAAGSLSPLRAPASSAAGGALPPLRAPTSSAADGALLAPPAPVSPGAPAAFVAAASAGGAGAALAPPASLTGGEQPDWSMLFAQLLDREAVVAPVTGSVASSLPEGSAPPTTLGAVELRGLLPSETGGVALINGRTLHEGDALPGTSFTLVTILADRVLLRSPDRTALVPLLLEPMGSRAVQAGP
ncbi:MAG TPA: hypothetical protein VK824_03475, partial [Planctomycetota bacterium]|nr:hypothetical protein [Planctomycetota bacterium]